MKVPRISRTTNKRIKAFSTQIKRKARKASFRSTLKIDAEAQFNRIKDALREVELIEAGKIKAVSLEEALDTMLDDYKSDKELTIFTQLGPEPFLENP